MREHVPVLNELEQATADGLRDGGSAVLANSNARAPKRNLELVKSGRVVVDDLSVSVQYTKRHAWIQHENRELQHPNGGEPGFLANADDEVDVLDLVADHVRSVLGG